MSRGAAFPWRGTREGLQLVPRVIRPPDSLVPPDLREQLQKTLGDSYTLERELGGGGMSRVFVALDTSLNRRVVVKVLPQDMSASVSIERFKREIALAARLQHPHIVPLLNAGATEGLPFFTMPLVEGESLRARLARGGELPVAEGVRILREVASALDYAHEKGVVHRDIKPDNVLLSRGSAVVSDFGVAKALSASSNGDESGMTSLGVALGTPAYMSPEQASANPNIDARADVYALGVMAYELFAGRPPFAGRSPQAMLAAHVAEQPEHIHKLRPVLPTALAALVMRCLEKHPADRPQTAAEIMHALDAITTPSGGSQPTAALPAVPSKSGIRPIAIVVAAVVIVAAVGYGAFKSRNGSTTPIRSIAVLPFENTGGDTAGTYFADGMRDEIATALGKLPTISVASRTSSYAFRGKTGVTTQQIGRELGVDAILECAVRRSGDQLRLSAQLTRASTGLGLWSEIFNRRVTDVFAVQEELARAIATALGAAVRGGTRETVSVAKTRGTDNQAAYDLYLRGRYLLNARSELPRALGYLENATRLDTTFAQAYAAAATVHSLLPFYQATDAPDAVRRAQSAARRALTLDSTLAEPHAAMAFGLALTFSWSEAEREFQHAVALDSMSAITHNLYGYVLRGIGRTEDARRLLERAVHLDPLASSPNLNYAAVLTMLGQADSALAIGRRLRALDSTSPAVHRILARAYRAKGDFASSAFELEAVNADPSAWVELLHTYARLGRRREADSIRVIIERRAGAGGRYADVFAAYLALGDKPNALRWLERAIDRHDAGLLNLGLFDAPSMQVARDDPDFRRLIDRLGVNR